MKKTVGFWLNCLEDDVREKWLNNYDHQYNLGMSLVDYLKCEITFSVFITSINWRYSPEGVDYWVKIYHTDEKKLIQQMRNRKLKQLGL